jgi:ribosomal protein S6--L-glutamate ligase
VCSTIEELRRLPACFFPFLAKPNFGDNADGIQLIRDRDDLGRIRSTADSVVLLQRFVPNDGFDLKLYVAGERVWAVRKVSPLLRCGQSKCSEVPLSREMRSIALRCGHVLGLDVYGVDALPTSDGIRVLEVNEFPNFTGVAEAPQAVADLLLARGSERRVARRGHPRR